MLIEKILVNGSKPKVSRQGKPDVKTKSLSKGEIKAKTSAKEKKSSGEVKLKDLNSMTLSELKKEAKSIEISGLSSMKKSDLIAALSKK